MIGANAYLFFSYTVLLPAWLLYYVFSSAIEGDKSEKKNSNGASMASKP
jgi:hypothetical protein